jgi:hypothetical protein
VAGITGAAVGGNPVYINGSGQLGLQGSSRRFKQGIKPMGDASDVLLSLAPVTYQYKPTIDPMGVAQFGLVAEEVEKICPDLVVKGNDGKPYSVRYDAVNAMLLNEFLKEHKRVEELEKKSEDQKKLIDDLLSRLNDLDGKVRQINDQVRDSKPRVVSTTLEQ